ncbi:N-6 DNA methylase [Corynebacterium sp. CCM 9185]|uniref:site-specific DNA-methyltransferase (adenine-specific) n=1 Tax=Corynebacterium marambiense TaxID=2765364 RepID=A0ABS0VZ20_9CORY|nr:N-6 DNA methylase [Corynebacterium marambiense]MBI9001594.1 N-6 DNA methylase [Corynebacterium marambiense]MCK7662060.1 N-6 DNA methylase [Corynebacterium marambiense]
MNNQEIVAKLWNLSNVLRDDGITYHQYVTELTYILFLKMAKETGSEDNIPAQYRWDELRTKSGIELKRFYRDLLQHLGEEATGRVQEIYAGSSTNIDEPKNLEKIIKSIDALGWYSAREEGLGNLYEGLLEKNANEKKSGAGQYFTPRVLIDVMVTLIDPQPGELCNDPACGTFGFMIAASEHVRNSTDNLFDLDADQAEFQIRKAFTGVELVHDTHRLALMNAMLHGIEAPIILGDTLSPDGKRIKGFDIVLSNPPFGTKKGGERATRDDLTFPTSNKQLNFLQHIYRSLKAGGRAAVVLPDNVLFADGDGRRIREDLMDKCNLHTILRLPTGIFYAQGVKTNVLFFERGTTDTSNTRGVWFYDLRSNMPSFGKKTPLTSEHFNGFKTAYLSNNRTQVHDERLSYFSHDQIAEFQSSLDLGLIHQEESALDLETFNPAQSAGEAAELFEEAATLLHLLAKQFDSKPTPERSQRKLIELGKWGGGGTPKKIRADYWTDGTIRWITPKDMKSDVIVDTIDKITVLGSKESSAHIFEGPAICIVTRSGILRRHLPVALANGTFTVNQDMKVLHSMGDDLVPEYVFWYLATHEGDIRKNCSKSGTTVESIDFAKLKNYEIPVPSREDQLELVATISKTMEAIDNLNDIVSRGISCADLLRRKLLATLLCE